MLLTDTAKLGRRSCAIFPAPFSDPPVAVEQLCRRPVPGSRLPIQKCGLAMRPLRSLFMAGPGQGACVVDIPSNSGIDRDGLLG